jgi:hypothetical protein
MIDPITLLALGYAGAVVAKLWGISKLKYPTAPVTTVARYSPPPPIRNSGRVDPTPTEFLDGLDDTECTPQECSQAPKVAGKWARMARTFLHIDQHDLATDMMIKDWVIAEMRKQNYRESVICTLIPYVLKYSYLPTRDEIAAREQTMSDGYRARYRTRRQLWKFSPGWDEWLSVPYLFKEEIIPDRR